ncbi:hypothetical protein G9A89_009216 [Geosiphon pyriformis]|nr:hypothetical protein G9A89_009216 [Geosiphon pyriformis]
MIDPTISTSTSTSISTSPPPIESLNNLKILNLEEYLPNKIRGHHILVLGATGRLGRHVVRQALEASYRVTALVRNDHRLPFTRQQLQNPNLVVFLGCVLSPTDLDKVIEDKDAVINCLSPRRLWNRNVDLNSRVQSLINDSMLRLGVKRLIIVRCHGTRTVKSILTRLFASKFHKDKVIQEKLIRDNSEHLDWTIIHVGSLSNEKLTKRYLLNRDEVSSKKISRANVAHFILQEIRTGIFVKRTPLIDGET